MTTVMSCCDQLMIMNMCPLPTVSSVSNCFTRLGLVTHLSLKGTSMQCVLQLTVCTCQDMPMLPDCSMASLADHASRGPLQRHWHTAIE
jgi:hypothetical protein